MSSKSYFPILIQYANEKEPTVVQKPEDIKSGVGFKVLQTNYKI